MPLSLIQLGHPSQKLVENDHFKNAPKFEKKSATNYPLWQKVGRFTFLANFFPKKKVGQNGYNPCTLRYSYSILGRFSTWLDFESVCDEAVKGTVLGISLQKSEARGWTVCV